MAKEEGYRYNEGKPRWSLVDFKSLEGMVRVLEYGADKYDDHNWKKGLKTTEICESLMRHLFSYLSGEDYDEETDLPHIDHILTNAMFLSWMMKNKPEFDTRYNQPKGIEAITADDINIPDAEISDIDSIHISNDHQVGDQVEIVDGSGHDFAIGDIATLIDYNTKLGLWLSENENGNNTWLLEDNFKPAKETGRSYGI